MATITTSRLSITPFEPSDWAFFRSLREDRSVMRYMAAIAPEKETRRVFAARLTAGHVFVIRLHDDDTPLGDIGLQISPENREEADIGYTVIPAAQGKGIASEALRAVCDYAFNQTGLTPGCWRITQGRYGCWRKPGLCARRCLRRHTRLTACGMTTGDIGWSAVRSEYPGPDLSGPVSEAPPGENQLR